MGNGESERAVQRSASYLAMALIYEIGARIPNCTFRSSRRWHLARGPSLGPRAEEVSESHVIVDKLGDGRAGLEALPRSGPLR